MKVDLHISVCHSKVTYFRIEVSSSRFASFEKYFSDISRVETNIIFVYIMAECLEQSKWKIFPIAATNDVELVA